MTARHKNDTQTFDGLTFPGQAKSINAQLSTLTRAIRAHIRKARERGRDHEQTRAKCIAQVNRLRQRIES
jgi:hypothetical protein